MVEKILRRLLGTSGRVPLGCALLYSLNTWGLPSLGMCLLQSSSICCSEIALEKQFLNHLGKIFFLVAFNFILHCVFYCLLAAISIFIVSP